MGRKCEFCSNYRIYLILKTWFIGSGDYLLQSDLDIKCASLTCNASQVGLSLSYCDSIRRSRNIMLLEVKCCKKIKLYSSDSFVENSTSNCVIISGQFEIFKTQWIPWLSSKWGQYKRGMSAFIQTSWAFLQLHKYSWVLWRQIPINSVVCNIFNI